MCSAAAGAHLHSQSYRKLEGLGSRSGIRIYDSLQKLAQTRRDGAHRAAAARHCTDKHSFIGH